MSDPRVRRMSPVAAKTYMMLLHEAFVCSTRPNLPDDDDELELLAWCADREEWLAVRETVLKMFTPEEIDGRRVLTNNRLTKDWSHLQEIREARSEAGKKGGLAKAGKSLPSKEVTEEQETEMKTELQYEILVQSLFHKKANLRGWNGEQLKRLEVIHKPSSVIRAFGEWAKVNRDNPDIQDPVRSFVMEADDLLAGESPVQSVAKDPGVVALVRELAYLSDGQVAFEDKHKARLAEVLSEFDAEDIKAAFRAWSMYQDFTDPKVQKWGAGEFVQKVDQIVSAAHRKRQEAEQAGKDRETAVARLQAEAEAERAAQETARAAEADVFDPLA